MKFPKGSVVVFAALVLLVGVSLATVPNAPKHERDDHDHDHDHDHKPHHGFDDHHKNDRYDDDDGRVCEFKPKDCSGLANEALTSCLLEAVQILNSQVMYQEEQMNHIDRRLRGAQGVIVLIVVASGIIGCIKCFKHARKERGPQVVHSFYPSHMAVPAPSPIGLNREMSSLNGNVASASGVGPSENTGAVLYDGSNPHRRSTDAPSNTLIRPASIQAQGQSRPYMYAQGNEGYVAYPQVPATTYPGHSTHVYNQHPSPFGAN